MGYHGITRYGPLSGVTPKPIGSLVPTCSEPWFQTGSKTRGLTNPMVLWSFWTCFWFKRSTILGCTMVYPIYKHTRVDANEVTQFETSLPRDLVPFWGITQQSGMHPSLGYSQWLLIKSPCLTIKTHHPKTLCQGILNCLELEAYKPWRICPRLWSQRSWWISPN